MSPAQANAQVPGKKLATDLVPATAAQKLLGWLEHVNAWILSLDPEKAGNYGIKKLVRTTGFAGLTVAAVLLSESTY